MMNANTNGAEIKLALFRYIDSLSDPKLQEMYDLLIANQQDAKDDFWNKLSDWAKADILDGLADLEAGNHKPIDQVLAKY